MYAYRGHALLLACLQSVCDTVLMDYDSVREHHTDLGTAAVIVMVSQIIAVGRAVTVGVQPVVGQLCHHLS